MAIVDRGRIMRQGPIDELIRTAGARSVQLDCADPAGLPRLIDEAGIAAGTSLTDAGLTVTLPAGASRELVADINRRLVGGGISVYGIQEVRASLEDWFLSVTTRLGEPVMTSRRALAVRGGRPRRAGRARGCPAGRPGSHVDLIATRHLELRKRRGLMIVVVVVIVGPTVLILGPAAAVPRVRPGTATARPGSPACSPREPTCWPDWGSSPPRCSARRPGPPT